jgi:hypothetical protein
VWYDKPIIRSLDPVNPVAQTDTPDEAMGDGIAIDSAGNPFTAEARRQA